MAGVFLYYNGRTVGLKHVMATKMQTLISIGLKN